MTTDIYVDTGDEISAPGRVDCIGSQSWDEHANALRGETLELKTNTEREYPTALD